MSTYQVSYLKTIVPAGFIALCVGALTTLWLIRGAVVLPFWSISVVAYPVMFWFMVVVGVVTMTLSCLVALGGVLCLRRAHQEEVAQKTSRPSCEKTAQI
jgi:hypothetical protein